MKKSELEKMGFVKLEELGIDTSNYRIDINDLYQLDVDRCHQKKVDYNETREKTISNEVGKFSSYGRIANFDWEALTQVYSKTMFTNISEDKKRQNQKHLASIRFGYQLGQYLNQALQDDIMFGTILGQQNFVIPDTSNIAWRGIREHTSYMVRHIRRFWGLNTNDGPILDIKENHLILSNGNLLDLKGKDVILPFIYANSDSIKFYGQIANIICNYAKANTASGIFITRIMPTMDGRNPKSLSQEEYVPIISPYFGMEIPPMGY
jgi:hypothetical protein